MKIAVGIIGLVLSMIALLQSCTVGGLSGIAGDETVSGAAAVGVFTAFFMFLGAAFSFGLPRVARVLFVIAFFLSIPARNEFPDMWIWGIVSLILAGLLMLVKKPKTSIPEGEVKSD